MSKRSPSALLSMLGLIGSERMVEGAVLAAEHDHMLNRRRGVDILVLPGVGGAGPGSLGCVGRRAPESTSQQRSRRDRGGPSLAWLFHLRPSCEVILRSRLPGEG